MFCINCCMFISKLVISLVRQRWLALFLSLSPCLVVQRKVCDWALIYVLRKKFTANNEGQKFWLVSPHSQAIRMTTHKVFQRYINTFCSMNNKYCRVLSLLESCQLSFNSNVWFISYSKCSNWHRISKLSSNFGCLFTFCHSAQANLSKTCNPKTGQSISYKYVNQF